MKSSHGKRSRIITAAEIGEWFGPSNTFRLSPKDYTEIAAGITRLRWPIDPLPPPDAPWLAKESEPDFDRWWNFVAATNAAKTLLVSAPAMLSFWEGQRWAPETRGGYDAILKLNDALSKALPFIEWPCGYYEPQARPKQPKLWHIMAGSITQIILRVLVKAGHNKIGITRNSVVVRIVRKALIRIGLPNSQMITLAAIGRYLTRWEKRFGLTPSGIAALTTKHHFDVCDHALALKRRSDIFRADG